MSDPAEGLDSLDSTSQSPLSEYNDCEARLRYVLAYISEKRYRRWIASATFFLLIFHTSQIPFNSLFSFTLDALELAGIGPNDIIPSPATLGLVLSAMTFIPPITITLLIFSRLRRIYKGY